MTDLRLDLNQHIPHPPEQVFDAWLDPAMLKRFMTPAEGVSVPEATIDPRVGGRFRIIMRPTEGEDIPHEGEYKEIERPRRLVFTWNSPFSQDDSTVTLEFVPKDGGTDVSLSHVRFPTASSRDSHEGGWTRILATLAGSI